jgi:hypothetical protein
MPKPVSHAVWNNHPLKDAMLVASAISAAAIADVSLHGCNAAGSLLTANVSAIVLIGHYSARIALLHKQIAELRAAAGNTDAPFKPLKSCPVP